MFWQSSVQQASGKNRICTPQRQSANQNRLPEYNPQGPRSFVESTGCKVLTNVRFRSELPELKCEDGALGSWSGQFRRPRSTNQGTARMRSHRVTCSSSLRVSRMLVIQNRHQTYSPLRRSPENRLRRRYFQSARPSHHDRHQLHRNRPTIPQTSDCHG